MPPHRHPAAPRAAAFALALSLAFAAPAAAQHPAEWSDPFPPFRIAGNVYYVGTVGLASYLVTTPQGHILINSNLAESVPQLRASVERLGFRFEEIRILLISHAHWDHNAGSAEIKRLTGAAYHVMAEDVEVVESGGRRDWQFGHLAEAHYPPTAVDRVLRHGDSVSLGGTTLVAHLTPGHTRGCTTWTLRVRDGDRDLDAVIVCSPWMNPRTPLVGNRAYPRIADDFQLTFRRLRALPADLFLGAHGSYFDLAGKHARLERGDAQPFVDRAGYLELIDAAEAAFREELARQQSARRAPGG